MISYHTLSFTLSPSLSYKGISVHIPLGYKSGGNGDVYNVGHSCSYHHSNGKPTEGRGDPARTCVVPWHGYLPEWNVGLAKDLERGVGGS